MVVVYERPLLVRFTASRISSAYCLFLVVAGVIVILPFFIAYAASGPSFWAKEAVYWEQPLVQYEYKYVLLLEGVASDGASPLALMSTSVAHLATAWGSNGNSGTTRLRVPVVRSREVDDDMDGKPDQLAFSAQVPLANGEAVHSATLLVFFTVTLSHWARMVIPVQALATHTSPLPGSALYLDADLVLRQRKPFPARGGYSPSGGSLLDDSSFLPWTGGNRSMQDFLPQLIKADRDRLYGADLSSGSSSGGSGAALWVGGAPSGGKSWANGGGSKSPGSTFNLTATMRFPSQPVTYVPGISEVLLQAWMPYLALALVVGWLLDRCFLGFVFRHRLVDCLEQSECPPLVPGAKSAWGQPRLKAY